MGAMGSANASSVAEVALLTGGEDQELALYAYIEMHGAIAQLGERLLCKQEVGGSIPPGSISEMPANWHVLALAAATEYP
jgi:hypothetical protein